MHTMITLFPARNKPVLRNVHPIIRLFTDAGREYAFTGNCLPLGRAVVARKLTMTEQDNVTTLAVRVTFPDGDWVQPTLTQRPCEEHGAHYHYETHTNNGVHPIPAFIEAIINSMPQEFGDGIAIDAWATATGDMPCAPAKFLRTMLRSVK